MKEKELPRKGGLSSCARTALEKYFHDLDGEKPASDFYDLVIREVERPLLEIVMKYVKSNQCRAAELLGINRNTLRKKLKLHKLDK